MVLSAINAHSKILRLGTAVTVLSGKARPASKSILATGIVTGASAPRGVLSISTDGTLDLPDWSAIAGTKRLIPGETYYTVDDGLIKSNQAHAQAIGVAVSKTELAIQISSGATVNQPYEIVQSNVAIPTASPSYQVILSAPRPPTLYDGKNGDWFMDSSAAKLYGPKMDSGWGGGYAFVT